MSAVPGVRLVDRGVTVVIRLDPLPTSGRGHKRSVTPRDERKTRLATLRENFVSWIAISNRNSRLALARRLLYASAELCIETARKDAEERPTHDDTDRPG